MNTVTEICAALRQIDTCTIVMHKRPDGDTIGSACALACALTRLGKRVLLACSDPITPKYTRWTGESILHPIPEGTVITVDIAAPDMAGDYQDVVQTADIVIDHHGSNPAFGTLNLIRPEAAAAGEIVYDIIRQLLPIDKEIAEPLYVAISTDTDCFRHASTTSYTHTVAAELMKTGLDILFLNRLLFVVQTKAAAKIRSAVLGTLREFAGGKIVCVTLTNAMIDACGAQEDDLENIAGLGLSMEGVTAAATVRELDTTACKISVRTDGSIDAAKVCGMFGGGGHPMAAGCTLYGSPEECATQIAEALCKE